MVPGEYRLQDGPIELNAGRRGCTVDVTHVGDRPIQVGSHFIFAEANAALHFDREAAAGMRLDIPAGTAVRFEPGEQRPVTLVELGGGRLVLGHRGLAGGGAAAGRDGAGASP